MNNKTLLQYFEWYLPADAGHWRRAAADAARLKEAGFTDIWLPPAYKGAGGIHDVGYGVYDLYDLGEFDQKGGIPTKYGTREEYLGAIHALHAQGLRVLPDIVLNHKMGADACEQVEAEECEEGNRAHEVEREGILAWTSFTFPGRGGKYSKFCWNHTHFDGVDWDERRRQKEIFLLDGKAWDAQVDAEKGNYDYLMGADLDMDNPEVIDELNRWGAWYLETTGADGFRLDAVKHIHFSFFKQWLSNLREKSGQGLWSVGEYWNADLSALTNYLDVCENAMSLFDVPLHFHLMQASCGGGQYDMRHIFDNTLVAARPESAVTFVDNHDTQPGQALESWVQGWFKPLAYALTLLRRDGTPCVFYGDYYGIPAGNINPVGEQLNRLLRLRADIAYGGQQDYFDDCNLVGWVRFGDEQHVNSGCAVVLTDGPGGSKTMCMGAAFAGRVFVDLLGNVQGEVTLDQNGCGSFAVNGGSVSVWGLRA